MQHRLLKLLPVWITAGVASLVCLLRLLLPQFPNLDLLEQLELITFDWRARQALATPGNVASNLAAIYVDEGSLQALNQGELGRYRWPWPRSVFGRVLRELNAQGAAVVGMDLFFLELDHDYLENRVGGLSSDEFFARQLAAGSNVVLATTAEDVYANRLSLLPIPELFRTNAWAVGHDGIRGGGEMDRGIFRKVPAFVVDPETGRRTWQLGILLAAKVLGIDLSKAVVEPGRIVLATRSGEKRVIPVDPQNRLYVDWRIGAQSTRLNEIVFQAPLGWLYSASLQRESGQSPMPFELAGRVVVLGYAAAGGKASDWGPTAVSEQTPLFLSHLNIANSLLINRFIQRSSFPIEALLVFGMAALAALLGWRLQVGWGIALAAVVSVAYLVLATWLFTAHGYWLPIIVPLFGALAMTHACLLTYRIALERIERRRMRRAFGHVVSPDVFNLLMQHPTPPLGGTRREVTVFFADVRGFTRFVEEHHARTVEQLRRQHLDAHAAETIIERQTRGTLDTVNLYIGKVADLVKSYDGTLDKYIGDCVMAFWGAPIENERHALAAVHTAIAVQKAVHALNQERLMQNRRNTPASAAGGAAEPDSNWPLPILHVGIAINSGTATVGFMGSTSHISNYTVFGRDVIIASRLEHVAGPDRIFITEATCAQIRRDAPELAATFIRLSPVELSGIPEPVQIYEVPWESSPPPPSH